LPGYSILWEFNQQLNCSNATQFLDTALAGVTTDGLAIFREDADGVTFQLQSAIGIDESFLESLQDCPAHQIAARQHFCS